MTLATAFWSFLASLGGAAIPLSVMWVKLRLDQLSARCDATAKVIEETAELALNYWLLGEDRGEPGSEAPAVEPAAAKTLAANITRHEIKLRGAQAILQLDISRLSRDLPANSRESMSQEFRSFITAITGTKFQDRDGFTEPEMAQEAVSASARLVRVIRSGRDAVSQPLNMFRFLSRRY